jgi:hypothetical protein
LLVALIAQQLKVFGAVAAAERHRNYVVELNLRIPLNWPPYFALKWPRSSRVLATREPEPSATSVRRSIRPRAYLLSVLN